MNKLSKQMKSVVNSDIRDRLNRDQVIDSENEIFFVLSGEFVAVQTIKVEDKGQEKGEKQA